MRKDFLASGLRYQLNILECALDDLESNSGDVDACFVDESLKRVEINLRRLRRASK